MVQEREEGQRKTGNITEWTGKNMVEDEQVIVSRCKWRQIVAESLTVHLGLITGYITQ